MKNGFLKIALVVLSFIATNSASAQIGDTIANSCARHLGNQFISDGQQYRALLMNADETAEFHTTLYGGTIYRVAACSGLNDGNLVFSVYDSEHNLLFTNSEFKNSPYWDFKITSTLDCTIEAHLDSGATGSGRAVILIGFRQAK